MNIWEVKLYKKSYFAHESNLQMMLIEGFRKIIELNYQYAEDKYGNGIVVETYECVKVARNCIESVGYDISIGVKEKLND